MSKPQRRPRQQRVHYQNRQPKRRIVILCEGLSEENYLKALFAHRYEDALHQKFALTISQVGGSSLKNLIETASQQKYSDADYIWLVCDVDQNNVHRLLLDKWIQKNPKRHHCVISHPCFESWLLAHFAPQTVPHNAGDAYARLLVHIPGYSKGERPSGDFLEKTDGAIQAMMNRATRLQEHTTLDPIWPDSGLSYLYRLIEFLDSL